MVDKKTRLNKIFKWFRGNPKEETKLSKHSIVESAFDFRNNASALAGKDPTEIKNAPRYYRESRKKSQTINASHPISMEEILKSKGYGGKKHTLRKKANKRKTKKSNRK